MMCPAGGPEMKIALIPLFVLCFCVFGLTADDNTTQAGELLGCWEELPLPMPRHGQISAMAVEPGGTLWVMTDGSLYYRTGQQFREPLNDKLTSGQYLTSLYGGPDRGLSKRLLYQHCVKTCVFVYTWME